MQNMSGIIYHLFCTDNGKAHLGQRPAKNSCFGSEWRKLHPEFGVGPKRSEETKEKMRQAKLGKKRSTDACHAVSAGMMGKRVKPIICLNDGRMFSSAKEASALYSVDTARVARGDRNDTKGLKFKWA